MHLLADAVWVGGLVVIVLERRYLVDDGTEPLSRRALTRFSLFAGYPVALILGTGILLGVLRVGSWSALLGTGYGWVVLAKALREELVMWDLATRRGGKEARRRKIRATPRIVFRSSSPESLEELQAKAGTLLRETKVLGS